MHPLWIIESNVEGIPSEPLLAEVRRQGMTCHRVKYLPSFPVPKDLAGAESLPRDACVIFRGSMPLMRHIQATRRWRPGGWCAFEDLACSTYYAHFGDSLLNRDYTLLPVAEAARLADPLFARYARQGQVFVRPDAADKSFTGKLADEVAFSHEFEGSRYDPTMLVLVATPRQIGREWRLIVAQSEVIAASEYGNGTTGEERSGCPEAVLEFASVVLKSVTWRPAPLFVMDICECEAGLRVLELNSFACSGHFSADLVSVVARASELAISAW